MTGLAIVAVISLIVGGCCISASFIAELYKLDVVERITGKTGLILFAVGLIFLSIDLAFKGKHTSQEKVKQIDTIEYSAKDYRIVEKVVEIENQRDTFYLVIGK